MNKFFLVLLSLFSFCLTSFNSTAQSQGVRGFVSDEQGNPLPMVSIYITSERTGTTTNPEGNYEIPLDTGKYLLVFKSLGFTRREFNLDIRKTWLDLDVTLFPQDYQLSEVKVYSSGEDPAYPIMRKAIGRAPYFLRQTDQYSAEVYLKGSFRMDKVPRILKNSLSIDIDGTEASIKEGQTYTMESLNEITFVAPDTFNHTVIASRNSFPAGDESAAIGFINSSFYEPDNGMVISPLAPQAMRHYNYRYEGFFYEEETEVNKIKVTPKRKSRQLMDGYIYIVDGLWNLHSVDLTNKAFFGTIRVRQLFQPVAKGAWLPVTHQFDLDVSIMGVKAVVDYTGSVKYKEVILNTDGGIAQLIKPEKSTKEETPKESDEIEMKPLEKKRAQQMENLLTKEDLNNREMIKLARLMEKENQTKEKPSSLEITNNYNLKIKKDSAALDSSFWNKMRPIPLTLDEQKSFLERDSLLELKITKTDSTANKKPKKFKKALSYTAGGKTWQLADSSIQLKYDGLLGLNKIGFNAVDGWCYDQSLSLTWQQDSLHRLTLTPSVTYAFARKTLMWHTTIQQTYAPLLRGSISLAGGQQSADYQETSLAVKPLANMAASLLFKENYKRYYNRQYVEVLNGLDLFNGFRWETRVDYEWLSPLGNNTDFSFFNKDKSYSPNTLQDGKWRGEDLQAQNAFSWQMKFSYTPRYYYRITKGRKEMSYSNYPTIYAAIRQGLPTLNSRADYLLIEGGIKKMSTPNLFPTLSWGAQAGSFLRNKSLPFSHYKHFDASTIPVSLLANRNYRLLNDYEPSTRQWFVNGHLKYTSPYLLLKYLPILSNRIWQESLHLDLLHTPQTRAYTQVGYSIDQIFFMGSIGIFAGFEEGKYQHWGISAALAF